MQKVALMTSLMFFMSSPALAGKKKKKKDDAADAPEQEASPETPGDALSKKFAKKLIEYPLKHFAPGDQLTYSSLIFKGDNTWTADAKVTLGFESDECTETGSWSMDPAQADNMAVVSWVVAQSDCVGPVRKGFEVRAILTIGKDGQYDVKMR